MTPDTRTVHTTTTIEPPAARRRMQPTRKIALAAGIAYLVTFAASIPQLKLFADVIADPAGYISNPGSNAALQWGSVLEFLTAASGVATAVLLYPVTRRVSRSAAIGFVTSRVIEAALILVGVVAILSVVTLQQHFAGATGAQAQALGVAGESLVAMRQWTFLLGPGVMAGVNDLLLGYILYRSGLVGRVISIIGLVGGPVPDRQGLPARWAGRPRRAVRLDPPARRRGLTSNPFSPATGGPSRRRAASLSMLT